jgi:hypothetical protein
MYIYFKGYYFLKLDEKKKALFTINEQVDTISYLKYITNV